MPEKKKKKSIELPISELTLRKYEKPGPKITKRELIRKLCLSLGLLQPGDSRDIIIDIFWAVIDSKRPISVKEIIKIAEKERKKEGLDASGLTYPNVCRQLRRIKQLMLIDVKADKYFLSENDTLKNIFNEKIIKYYAASIIGRINEYIDQLH
jgi:hypothetical protein